ncbi:MULTISPECIES: hypothetical protein [Pseudomonas]|uniref:hypothetical protein n=1 Tax=Pseudomonas nitroreducens TaxID=46680 RepID=UPI001481623E|nr:MULTISPECIES: hypothetical protein [Pseudomonas]NNN28304.1 hypothetical protein [Pseudomonas nitroreducens]
MRFLKVFLLLGLFGFGVVLISGVAEEVRREAPAIVFGSKAEAAKFQAKLSAAWNSGGEALEEAKRLSGDFRAKLSMMYTTIYIWQAIFSFLLLLAATMLYLRFSQKKA